MITTIIIVIMIMMMILFFFIIIIIIIIRGTPGGEAGEAHGGRWIRRLGGHPGCARVLFSTNQGDEAMNRDRPPSIPTVRDETRCNPPEYYHYYYYYNYNYYYY